MNAHKWTACCICTWVLIGLMRASAADPAETAVSSILSRGQSYSGEHVDSLAALGPDAVPALVILLPSHEFPSTILEALGRIRDRRATGPLLDYLRERVQRSQGADDVITIRTLITIEEIGDPAAAAYLAGLLDNAGAGVRVRLYAAMAILAFGSNEQRERARAFVMNTWASLAEDTDGTRDCDILPEDMDRALVRAGTPDSIGIALEGLKQGLLTHRARALIGQLAKICTPEVAEALAQVAADDSYEDLVRLEAAEVLTRCDSAVSHAFIEQLLPDIIVRAGELLDIEQTVLQRIQASQAPPSLLRMAGHRIYSCALEASTTADDRRPAFLLRVTDMESNSAIREYQMPFLFMFRSEALERWPARWDMTKENLIASLLLQLHPPYRSFGLERMPFRSAEPLREGEIPPRFGTPGPSLPTRGARLWGATPVSLLSDIEMLLLYVPCAESSLYYDLISLDEETVAVCALLGDRFTVWTGQPWEEDTRGLRARYAGPPLFSDNRWIRVASAEAPFSGPFTAVKHGSNLIVVTASGKAYLAEHVFDRRPAADAPHPPPVNSGTVGSPRLNAELPERFFGEPDTELRPVEGLENVELVVDDKDLDELFYFTPGAIVTAGGVRTPLAGKTAPVPETARGPMRTVLRHLPALQAARAAAQREPGPP